MASDAPISTYRPDVDGLVAPGGDPSRIFVFDQSHLTPAGSDYLAQRLLASYLR